MTDLLPVITCPTLILAGEHDPVSPAAVAGRLAASLPRAPVTLRTFAGIGHGTFRQATAQAFASVRRFLAGADAGAGRAGPGSAGVTI